MAEHVRLDPDNATPRELAIAEVIDVWSRLADDFARIRANDLAPSPEWLPYLAAEYGLGELIPYVPDLAQLIAVGPYWQRKRGTPSAIRTGLSWVGYGATIEWALPRRRRWHLWQMLLGRLPDAERPDLDRIDGIASLSDDATSHFWRGYRGYDVRPAETGSSRWGSAMWGASSGVRIRDGAAIWSFGRPLIVDRVATEAELTALGAWIPLAGTSDRWVDMTFPWATANYRWAIPGAEARRLAIASDLASRTWHMVFRDGAGALIGACRVIRHAVAEAPAGAYQIGAGRWSPSPKPAAFLLRSSTPFAVPAAGRTVASIGIVSGASLSEGTPAGRQWLTPSMINPATGVGITVATNLSLTLAATIREIVTVLLRIN